MFLVNILVSIPFTSKEREPLADNFTIKKSGKGRKFFR